MKPQPLDKVIPAFTKEQESAVVRDPEQLKRFLVATDRKYLVFNVVDLIDSMPFPQSVELAQQLVDAYRVQRRKKTVTVKRGGRDVQVLGEELLEADEAAEAGGQLLRHAAEMAARRSQE